MARHARSRTQRRSAEQTPRGGRAVTVAAVLVGALALAGLVWVLVGKDDGAGTAGGCTDGTTVRVAADPATLPAVQAALADPVAIDGACAVAEVTGQPSLQTLADVNALGADALPQVWVPDASLWAARAGQDAVQAAGTLGRTPLVLATSRAATEALGWAQTPPTWGEAFTSERPPLLADLSGSAGAITVLAAVRESLGGDEAADNAVVAGVLAANRAALPAVSDVLAAGATGDPAAAVAAVSEQAVLQLAAGEPDSQLVPVYPADGSPWLEVPVLRVTGADGSGDAAVDAVIARLTGADGARAAQAAGYRSAPGSAPDGAGEVTGVPAQPPAELPLTAAAVQQLLGRLAELATPSRLLTVVDVSTSMNAQVGAGTRATLARDATTSALSLLPDDYSGGLWVFASRLSGDQDWVQLAPLREFGADAGGQTQRQLLASQFASIPDLLSPGGTGLYDTTLAAVRAARDAYDPEAVNSVVLITDGADEDDGITLPALLDTLRAEADPNRPVKVVAIALGPDADQDALAQIAEATGGASYTALDPRDLQSVLFDAIRRRG